MAREGSVRDGRNGPSLPRLACVIPARAGSKRIPHKNLKELGGKPLVQWSIEATVASGAFTGGVWVTSDDEQILWLAMALGATPIERPAELAADHVSAHAPVTHAVALIEERASGGRGGRAIRPSR